jgi:hypothetical protein
LHGVEQVRDEWENITILDGYGVYWAIFHTHTQCSVRISHEL